MCFLRIEITAGRKNRNSQSGISVSWTSGESPTVATPSYAGGNAGIPMVSRRREFKSLTKELYLENGTVDILAYVRNDNSDAAIQADSINSGAIEGDYAVF